MQFPGTREQLIAASQEAAHRSGFRVTAADPAAGVVHQCLLPTQVIDWGKNKRNVNRFFGHLAALLQPAQFPPQPPPAQFPPR